MSDSKAPALIGSVLLHLGLLGVALWTWPKHSQLKFESAVPVTIVSQVPAAPAPAPTPSPEPPAPAPVPPLLGEAPPPPPPKPEPTPPKPKPPEPKPVEPKPVPKPAPPKPTPEKAQPTKTPPTPTKAKTPTRDDSLDLAALTASLNKTPTKAAPRSTPAPAPAKPGGGAQTANQAPQLTGPAIAALADKLNRLWNPNCGVEGADRIVIKVQFSLNSFGKLASQPHVISGPVAGVDRAVWEAAAERATRAVREGEPYSDLPRDFFNQPLVVKFNGEQACH